jgi:hypothetical protein
MYTITIMRVLNSLFVFILKDFVKVNMANHIILVVVCY